MPHRNEPDSHKQQNSVNTRTALTTNLFYRPSLTPLFWLLQVRAQTSEAFRVSQQELRVTEREGAWEIPLSISITISNCAHDRARYLNPLQSGYTTSLALRDNRLLARARTAPSLLKCIRQEYTRKIKISVLLLHFFFSFIVTICQYFHVVTANILFFL